MITKRSPDMLAELVPLPGRVVLDIGCGDGGLARVMARLGAHVTGIEVSPVQLARAMAADKVADEHFLAGRAERLPVGDGTVDVVVFANSLHHVPVADQPRALAEAARVLKGGGVLYISEPLAEGPFFALTSLIDDETEVRARALAALKSAGQWGLVEEKELVHIHPVRQADYPSFRSMMVAIDGDRAAKVEALGDELAEAFHRLGTPLPEKGWSFDQPTRVNLLRKHR